MGWAGGSGGGGNMLKVAGAQEVVLTTSGGLGEAETAGVILNVIPREGANTFSGQFIFSGANGAMQGSNYTQALKDAGPEDAVRAHQRVRRQSDGRRPDRPRQAVVLHRPIARPGARTRSRACGSTRTPATRTPGRSISTRASRRSPTRWSGRRRCGSRGRRRRATSSISTGPSSTTTPTTTGRRHGDADARSDEPDALQPVPSAAGHLVVAGHEPAAARGRLGHVPGAVPHRAARSTAPTTRG